MSGDDKKEDVPDDPAVAESRASTDEDGSYVGRAGGDDSFDDEETGAEARADDAPSENRDGAVEPTEPPD